MSSETTAIPLEIVSPEEQKELLAVVQQNGLPPEAAVSLQSSFAPAFAEARAILVQSRAIVVTDSSQKLQIKLARECRLALKEIRVTADKTRKGLKDESLRTSRAIDGFYNILLHLTEAEETRLAEQEQFAERQEQARKDALKAKRAEILVALAIDPNLYSLAEMSDETFTQLVDGTKLARAAQAEAAKKAEADRIAKEAADAAERERIRQENERLKAEADAKEKELAAERERVAKEKADAAASAKAELDRREALAAEERKKAEEAAAEIRRVADENAKKAAAKAAADKRAADAKLAAERKKAEDDAAAERKRVEAERAAAAEKARIEREAAEAVAAKERAARERLEAEANERRAAEAKAAAAHAAAEKRAAAAPDREKLLALAEAIRDLPVPTLSSPDAWTILEEVKKRSAELYTWIRAEAGKL